MNLGGRSHSDHTATPFGRKYEIVNMRRFSMCEVLVSPGGFCNDIC